jgi:hypothetical protein
VGLCGTARTGGANLRQIEPRAKAASVQFVRSVYETDSLERPLSAKSGHSKIAG